MKKFVVMEKRINLVSRDYTSIDIMKYDKLDNALDYLKWLKELLPNIGYRNIDMVTNCEIRAISPLGDGQVTFAIRNIY